MFWLGIQRQISIDYTLDEDGPEDAILNAANDARWIECSVPPLPDDINISALYDCIEHTYGKVTVEIAEKPFADGGHRISYHGKPKSFDGRGKLSGCETVVMKRFIRQKTGDVSQDYFSVMRAQCVAAYLATKFNKVSPIGSK